jgi:hypothetical protein
MAARALGEVGALAESALTIVTSNAVLRARIGEMLHRRDRADLSRLRQTSAAHIVTTVAVQTLARAVIRVAETNPKRAGRNGRR